MATISEKEARQVAEAAREAEWTLPSFGKQLFLGDFRLDLIHPQPQVDPAAGEKGERFLARLRAFLEGHVDPLEIEREAKIPEHVVEGLKRLGALGMKVSEEYGGLGLSQVHYNRALALAGVWHASISSGSTSVSRNSRSCARKRSPLRVASASRRGCGWMRSSLKRPRKSSLPKLGSVHSRSRAASATWRASFSLTDVVAMFRSCPKAQLSAPVARWN